MHIYANASLSSGWTEVDATRQALQGDAQREKPASQRGALAALCCKRKAHATGVSPDKKDYLSALKIEIASAQRPVPAQSAWPADRAVANRHWNRVKDTNLPPRQALQLLVPSDRALAPVVRSTMNVPQEGVDDLLHRARATAATPAHARAETLATFAHRLDEIGEIYGYAGDIGGATYQKAYALLYRHMLRIGCGNARAQAFTALAGVAHAGRYDLIQHRALVNALAYLPDPTAWATLHFALMRACKQLPRLQREAGLRLLETALNRPYPPGKESRGLHAQLQRQEAIGFRPQANMVLKILQEGARRGHKKYRKVLMKPMSFSVAMYRASALLKLANNACTVPRDHPMRFVAFQMLLEQAGRLPINLRTGVILTLAEMVYPKPGSVDNADVDAVYQNLLELIQGIALQHPNYATLALIALASSTRSVAGERLLTDEQRQRYVAIIHLLPIPLREAARDHIKLHVRLDDASAISERRGCRIF